MISLTVISIVVVALPPVLFAYTVYVVNVESTVGLPLILPVVASMDRPLGKAGWIAQDVTVPPLYVGVTSVMAVPFVSTNELGL